MEGDDGGLGSIAKAVCKRQLSPSACDRVAKLSTIPGLDRFGAAHYFGPALKRVDGMVDIGAYRVKIIIINSARKAGLRPAYDPSISQSGWWLAHPGLRYCTTSPVRTNTVSRTLQDSLERSFESPGWFGHLSRNFVGKNNLNSSRKNLQIITRCWQTRGWDVTEGGTCRSIPVWQGSWNFCPFNGERAASQPGGGAGVALGSRLRLFWFPSCNPRNRNQGCSGPSPHSHVRL